MRRRLPSSQPNHEKQYVPFLLSTTPPTAFEGLNAYCVSIYDQDGRKMESASRIAKKCLYNTLGLYEFNGMLIGLRKHPLHSKEWRTFCWGCRNGRLACATGTFLLIFPPHLTNITSIYATSSAPYLRFSSSYTVLNVGSVVVPSRTPSIYSVNIELGHRHPKLAQCLIFRNTRIAAEALLGYAFVPFVLLLTLQDLQNPFSVAQNTRLLQMGRYLYNSWQSYISLDDCFYFRLFRQHRTDRGAYPCQWIGTWRLPGPAHIQCGTCHRLCQSTTFTLWTQQHYNRTTISRGCSICSQISLAPFRSTL